MVKLIGVVAALALFGVLVTLGRTAWKSRKWKKVGRYRVLDARD